MPLTMPREVFITCAVAGAGGVVAAREADLPAPPARTNEPPPHLR